MLFADRIRDAPRHGILRTTLCIRRAMSVADASLWWNPGHLIQGEERFVVSWDGQDEGEVRFGVWSVSRGNGPLGSMLFPLMKPMQ